MIGKRERASVVHPTDRRRILFVSDDVRYPKTQPAGQSVTQPFYPSGGMELRGNELFDMLQKSYVLALLTRVGFSAGPTSVGISCPAWEFDLPRNIMARPYIRARWMMSGASFMALGRRRLRILLARFRPDLVYLHKFHALHPGVLYELLALPVPLVARFSDCHSQRLAAVVGGIQFTESVRKTLLPVPRPKKGTSDRMVLLFNCNFTRDFYTPRFPSVAGRRVIAAAGKALVRRGRQRSPRHGPTVRR